MSTTTSPQLTSLETCEVFVSCAGGRGRPRVALWCRPETATPKTHQKTRGMQTRPGDTSRSEQNGADHFAFFLEPLLSTPSSGWAARPTHFALSMAPLKRLASHADDAACRELVVEVRTASQTRPCSLSRACHCWASAQRRPCSHSCGSACLSSVPANLPLSLAMVIASILVRCHLVSARRS